MVGSTKLKLHTANWPKHEIVQRTAASTALAKGYLDHAASSNRV